MKRFIMSLLLAFVVSSLFVVPALASKVMMYSSMQEDQLVAIKRGFEAKYPGIVMDYYFAGTGRVITKIATEHQAGQVAADVIWVGDPARKKESCRNILHLKQKQLTQNLLIQTAIIPARV